MMSLRHGGPTGRGGWRLGVLVGTLVVLTVVALGGASIATGGSGSGPAHFMPTRTRGAVLAASETGPMTYHGGPVMHTNHVYAIYWIPDGFSVEDGYTQLIDQYFSDVAAADGSTDNVYSVGTQYTDTTGPITYGSSFAGSVIVTDPLPDGGSDCSDDYTDYCLTDAQIRDEMASVMDSEGWQGGTSNLYFLFTPEDVGSCFGSSCSFSQWCGYHSWFDNNGQQVIYANLAYDAWNWDCDSGGRPNGNDADATLNVVSHEQMESVTDPLLNAWYAGDLGGEIGDKCAWNFGDAGDPNQTINGDSYFLQQEWSNADSGCVYGYSAPAKPAKLASFAPAKAVEGATVKIHGSGFTGATDVQFNGVDAANFNVATDKLITAVVPADATSGLVTVTTGAGSISSRTQFKVVPTITSFTPPVALPGTQLTISGTGFLGVTDVKFGSKLATPFTIDSDTQITVDAPIGVTKGSLTVSGPGVSAKSKSVFDPVLIRSFTPRKGKSGAKITK